MTSQIPAKRALPQKEAALFRTLLSLYETKLFKKAVKTADTILKKFPEHGETLCMKGLVLHSMDRRAEGWELIRKGVRLDLTSHICWHVMGIAYKVERNYEETLKSYTMALKFDKDNMSILREVAQLQVQLRQYEAHVETRNTLLRLKPQLRASWIALALAHHQNGDNTQAATVLEHYESMMKNVPDRDPEFSEVLLFHVRVLEDGSEFERALSFLDMNHQNGRIIDKVSVRNIRPRLLTKLRRRLEAEDSWRVLIERNPDCYDHYRDFLSNRGLDLDSPTDENRSELLHVLSEFANQYPRASAPRRLALDIAQGIEFRSLVHPYIVAGLRRGSPSLFSDLKSLYTQAEKQTVIEELAEQVRDQLATSNALEDAEPSSAGESPTTYLWTLYFLGQHYSHLKAFHKALMILDEAIQHTPTLPELHMVKARLLKRAGDPYGAAECMEEARQLDGQDRFLNGKTAKYRMGAGDLEGANVLLGMFTKKDAVSPGADLTDMQSVQYLLEEGRARTRQERLGLALKRYRSVTKTFDDYEDDQFDYYMYTLRKHTLNAYLSVLAFEDKLRSHPAYVEAAVSAAKIYVRLYDDPQLASRTIESETKGGRKKKRHDASDKVAAHSNGTNGKHTSDAPSPAVDLDPDGRDLLSVKDPLQEATSLLSPVELFLPGPIELWLVLFDVALRRKKFLQALRALNAAQSIQPDHPELHIRIVNFALSEVSSSEPAVTATIKKALAVLMPHHSLETYTSDYLQRHSTSGPAVLAAARAVHLLRGPNGRADVESLLMQLSREECQADVETCLQAIGFLGTEFDTAAVEDFRKACATRFPLSTVFLPAEVVAARRIRIAEIRDNAL